MYDLISSEYGWSDQQIGELPFMRFQQIGAAISLRRYMRQREENSRISWLGRTISQFVAGGYMGDGQSENTALTLAQQVSYDPIEAMMLKARAEKMERSPSAPAPVEAKRGSFEAIMGLMGQTRD